MSDDKKKSLTVLGITLGIIIFFGIYLVVAYFTKLWPFADYQRSELTDGLFYPTGNIVELAPEEIAYRQKLLACLDKEGIRQFNDKCVGVVV